ncbi:MAG TPA: gephyrin-like molybdotransferase Glp [Methanobacterium sp.]|nr:gephyrin-like molybdotransferase Glp [Methanobacterium sp.]
MFLYTLKPVQQAFEVIEKSMKQTTTEKIPLENAYKRIASQDVISQLDSPPFSRSAMDGYAVKAEDTFKASAKNPAQLFVVDRIGAGSKSHVVLKNGMAVKIATGAPIPEGADAVVMEEYTQEQGDKLEVETSLTPGDNVSYQGEDIKRDAVLIKQGKFLLPQDMAMIASGGYDEVVVYKKPRVAVLITGSELVMPRKLLKDAEVINSNHYTLKALVESSEALPALFHMEDDEDKVKEMFIRLLENYDVLITTGGTAISKGDVVVKVADELGEILIHGVAMRPGKPFTYAMVNDKPVFMLSGYPVAAMVQYDVMVRKNLEKMQNLKIPLQMVRKKAARKIPSTLGRVDYIRAKVEGDIVTPLNIKGSTNIRSMVDSNCYIVIEENLEGLDKDAECDVILYDALRV